MGEDSLTSTSILVQFQNWTASNHQENSFTFTYLAPATILTFGIFITALLAMGLQDLPNEILYQVFSHLDNGSPSMKVLRREPSIMMTDSENKSLKTLSATSHFLRSLTLPHLFRFSRVALQSLLLKEPQWHGEYSRSLPSCVDIERFLNFLAARSLADYVEGIVLYTQYDLEVQHQQQSESGTCDTDGNLQLVGLCRSIVAQLRNLRFVTICAPPSTLARLVCCTIQTHDAWAFDMPLHILHLSRPLDRAYPISLPAPQVFDLLHLLPWTHCTLNEGSSLKVYSTYEYYGKTSPSILSQFPYSPEKSPPISLSRFMKTVDYIAIFPLLGYSSSIFGFLHRLPFVDKLGMQLVPHPEDHIFENQSRVETALLADMWLEFKADYRRVLQNVLIHSREVGGITEFVSYDYSMKGIQTIIDESCKDYLYDWHDCGNGHWQLRDGLD